MARGRSSNNYSSSSLSFGTILIRMLRKVPATPRTIVALLALSVCCLLVVNSLLGAGSRGDNVIGANRGDNQNNGRKVVSDHYRPVSPKVKTVHEFKGEAMLVNRKAETNRDNSVQSEHIISDEEKRYKGLQKPEFADKVANASVVEKIMRMFAKTDVNNDGKLSAAEISKLINSRVKGHFAESVRQNFGGFFAIDTGPRNGRVEWDEYLQFHLRQIKYDGPKITAEKLQNKTFFKQLPKGIRVDIAALEARWSESAQNDPNFLTVDEFLAFNHPEVSPSKLMQAAQDVFSTFDLDGNGVIMKTEFDTTYREAEGVDPVYKQDLSFIDTDNNGKITRLELMRYMDPKNMVHSDKEATKLIKDCDTNGDSHLDLNEVFNHVIVIQKSRLYDIDLYYHADQLFS